MLESKSAIHLSIVRAQQWTRYRWTLSKHWLTQNVKGVCTWVESKGRRGVCVWVRDRDRDRWTLGELSEIRVRNCPQQPLPPHSLHTGDPSLGSLIVGGEGSLCHKGNLAMLGPGMSKRHNRWVQLYSQRTNRGRGCNFPQQIIKPVISPHYFLFPHFLFYYFRTLSNKRKKQIWIGKFSLSSRVCRASCITWACSQPPPTSSQAAWGGAQAPEFGRLWANSNWSNQNVFCISNLHFNICSTV